MKLIEVDLNEQPYDCRPSAKLPGPVTYSHALYHVYVDDFAVRGLWPWAQTQIRHIDSVADVRAQINVLSSHLAALQLAQRVKEASDASSANSGFDFCAEVEFQSARLRMHTLQVVLRHLERFERQQVRETFGEDSDQGGVSSPSWEIWQGFVAGSPVEGAGVPSAQTIAQEMVGAGLLREVEAKLAASIIHYFATSIVMKMGRGLFFEEIALPFVHDYLETLSMAASNVRTLAARRMLDGPSETGSAAAIAKRLNPLGAPPQFA